MDKVRGILQTIGIDGSRQLLFEGHAGGKGPTVYNWLVGITKGKDLISGVQYFPDVKGKYNCPWSNKGEKSRKEKFSAAMGRSRVEEEAKGQKGLIRFEARLSKGMNQPASKWLEHASNLFGIAMLIRGRASGKGKTGLKPGKKENDLAYSEN